MSTKPPAPDDTTRWNPYQDLGRDEPAPPCQNCGECEPSKNGTYGRHPHGSDAVRVQQYRCANGGFFSETLDWIDDGYRYPKIIIRLCLAVYILTDASLGTIQEIVLIVFGEKPSTQRINEWVSEAGQSQRSDREWTRFGKIVSNVLPTNSGIYTYDEQYINFDNQRAYRLTLYDSLVRAPVAEMITLHCTKEAITEFLTTVLKDKPIYTVTTDGRVDYTEIIEEKLGELVGEDCGVKQYRCLFHFLGNVTDALDRELESVRHSPIEKCRMAIVTSDFKQALREPSYPAAMRRFEEVLEKLDPLTPKLEGYVKEVMEDFERFAGSLRDDWVPATTNDCEQYYSHTRPGRRIQRLQSPTRADDVLSQQQQMRTIKEGFVSEETSIEIAEELFPGINPETVKMLFVESKDRYLRARDIAAE